MGSVMVLLLLLLFNEQLALTAAPPSTDIFVFTDAPAKDPMLRSTVRALIESTKSKVTPHRYFLSCSVTHPCLIRGIQHHLT